MNYKQDVDICDGFEYKSGYRFKNERNVRKMPKITYKTNKYELI